MAGTINQLCRLKDIQIKVIVFVDTVKYNGDKIIEEFRNSMRTQKLGSTLYHYEADNLEKDKQNIRKIIYDHRDYDVVFAPSKRSTHQDHRLIGEAVDDIMLENTVLYYEDIRSGTHENINFWNKLSEEDMEAKYRMIAQYNTQLAKRHYFNNEAIRTMAMFRGGQVNTKYAEAFEVLRLVR